MEGILEPAKLPRRPLLYLLRPSHRLQQLLPQIRPLGTSRAQVIDVQSRHVGNVLSRHQQGVVRIYLERLLS